MTDKARQYLSGAKKRKQKTEKLEAIGKLPKIDGFFKAIGETRINQENEDKKDDIREENISQKVITGDSEGGTNPDQTSVEYYYTTTKTGQKIDRFWLCYSEILNAVYCQPCWLFSDREQSHAWSDGTISDWKGLSKKIKKHEESATHFHACITYTSWEKNKTVDKLIQGSQETIKEVLIRIFDTTRTLAICSLPFRGHHENIYEIGPQSGNFLNIIDFLSRYDPLLKSHITNKNNRNKYLHHDTQNEIITLMSKSVVEEIVSEISKAPFFSLIVDTTQDISKKDQLSIIIRHVKVDLDHDKSIAGKIEIKESFLGFIEIGDQSAKNFECVILSTLKELKIDIGKCRGQGYDGASNMSGKYSGLQARIKEKVPTADFIHCSAHNLNLVLNDSVQNVSEIRNFYGLLENIYLFFSKSLPRWQELNKSKEENAMIKKTLKRLCPTRWSSRFDCLSAIKYNYKCVMQCLSTFILICKKTSDRIEANSLQKSMSSYDFILLLVYQSKILENISLVSKLLQSSTVDLGRACELLSSTIDNFNTIRDDFEILHAEATNLATSWNIQPKLKSKRQRMVKTFFDELATDTGIEDSLRRFQIKVFYESLDIIINQLRTRFISMNKVMSYFLFLNPDGFVKLSTREIIDHVEKILEKYENDFSNNLSTQLINFQSVFSNEIRKKKTIYELATYFISENRCILSSLPDVCSLFQLFLTLPVTSASAERTFSKLKLIKTYLRSTMCKERLSALGVISIEHERARKLDLGQLVDIFLKQKHRRFGNLTVLP